MKPRLNRQPRPDTLADMVTTFIFLDVAAIKPAFVAATFRYQAGAHEHRRAHIKG